MSLGITYDQDRDGPRLDKQREVIWRIIRGGEWWTLDKIAEATRSDELPYGYPLQSISARLRDFRKRRYGGHTIERKNIMRGLWAYRRVVPQADENQA